MRDVRTRLKRMLAGPRRWLPAVAGFVAAGTFASAVLATLIRPAPPAVPDDAWERLAAADRCLAQAVYFEARGEPFEGRMAVAQVVLNRVADPRWPAQLCAVVFQNQHRRHNCQFSFACDGKADRPREDAAWQSALHLARLLNAGHIRDLTGQATHFHAVHVRPFWTAAFTPTVSIGRHRFYRAAKGV
jgi:spore germination cell wall hydrolase CwlJ-like protein